MAFGAPTNCLGAVKLSLVYSIFILEKFFQYNSTGLPRGPD